VKIDSENKSANFSIKPQTALKFKIIETIWYQFAQKLSVSEGLTLLPGGLHT